MKMSMMLILVAALIAANLPQAASARLDMEGKPPTIGKVVEFLGKMLIKSKSEGEAEQKVFGEFKCYCDDNDKSKSSEIKQLTEDISKLGSEIEGAQSENGELSTQCAKLKTDIADNLESQSQAKGIRSKASKDFQAERTDLSKGIRQMDQAVRMLAAVGGDQTQSSGADHAKFMAGHKSASFLKLDVDVKHALEAASALVPEEQRSTFDSFLQAPFTGSYSSQSGAVVGILKSMRDTYDSNLKSAIDAEKSDAKAHAALMKNLVEVEIEMKKAYDDKQEDLGANDSELGAKKLHLNLRMMLKIQLRTSSRHCSLCARRKHRSLRLAICSVRMRRPPLQRPWRCWTQIRHSRCLLNLMTGIPCCNCMLNARLARSRSGCKHTIFLKVQPSTMLGLQGSQT